MPLDREETKVLLALMNQDSVPKSHLEKNAGLSQLAVSNAVRALVAMNLVEEKEERGSLRHAKIVTLTPFAHKILPHLKQVEEQLNLAQKHAKAEVK